MNIKRTLVLSVAATALTAGVAMPSANASVNLFAPVTTATPQGNITTYCPATNLLLSILSGTKTTTTTTKTPATTKTPVTTKTPATTSTPTSTTTTTPVTASNV